jgi:hypothetical protein
VGLLAARIELMHLTRDGRDKRVGHEDHTT